MTTIDPAQLETVTGGAQWGKALKTIGEWGGRGLNWAGAAQQVGDWWGRLTGSGQQGQQPQK